MSQYYTTHRNTIPMQPGMTNKTAFSRAAFTLIELSIVLVIIGLIVGGILVGRDLIAAAELRAQVTQIEKFNQAVNNFRGKYGYLPGDMLPGPAAQFGFTVGLYCDDTGGKRDGNGLITGYISVPMLQTYGETSLFWQDLSSPVAGGLIEGQFPASGLAPIGCSVSLTLSSTQLSQYFPLAKIGKNSNYIYVYTDGVSNWYGMSAMTSINAGEVLSNTNIPVLQAYNIDKKIDDGLPMSGNVLAQYLNNSFYVTSTAPSTSVSGGNASSCYDTITSTYSITFNNGAGVNCALSFRFQ